MSDTADRGLVSIVLPTYNRAHLLPGAIESVLAQTWQHLELIVVDDNSPDQTAEVVAGYDDPRIRYLKNDPNLRLPRALNRGFAEARGEFLTWTSDDNFFAPTAIERMVGRLQKGDCDFVYADYWLFAETDPSGEPVVIRQDRLPDALRLEKGNHIGACFLYTRRLYETVGDYDPELFLVEDYDYFIRASKQFSFCHIPEPLYYFRRDDQTLYCSRFCQVKASDLLVRFKNGLLDQEGIVEAVVALLMRQPEQLLPVPVGDVHRLLKGLSFRLERRYREYLRKRLRYRLDRALPTILECYREGSESFGESRDRLCALLRSLSRMEYAQP